MLVQFLSFVSYFTVTKVKMDTSLRQTVEAGPFYRELTVINKIGRPFCCGSPICLIATKVIDRTGLHSVLLRLSQSPFKFFSGLVVGWAF